MTFVGHLHVHDEVSPLDGTGTRNQLTKQTIKQGQTHLGCTNHGRLGSVLDHIQACRHPELLDDPEEPESKRSKDEVLTPWVGIEAFWRPDRFMDLTDQSQFGKNGHNWAQHLCVHAGSLTGWKTLMRLSSKSWVRREQGGGFYGKPCFDWQMLEHDSEDIIISTACLASPLAQLIIDGAEEEAVGWCEDMIGIVGEKNLFLEIMPHDLDLQRQVNIGKINIAEQLGLPVVVSGDVHVPYRCWKDTQSIVRMAAYRTTISEQSKKREAGEEVYTSEIDTLFLSSEDELKEMFAEFHPDIDPDMVQEALDNTEVFAGRFKPYVIGKATKLPKVSKSNAHSERTLQQWCLQGLKRIGKSTDKSYIKRYEYEFGVLKSKRILDYFIITGDMVRWAKSDAPLPGDSRRKRNIRVGLGRGSAPGSLISYLIGITSIDPLAWGLKFERFLNPDRLGLPDIDLDFETELPILEVNGVELDGREMVKEYLRRTYGHDHVADIIAYQTFAPRAVIKAVADVFEVPFEEIKRTTDSIGDTERELPKLVKDNETLAKFRDDHPEPWKHMLRLEDQILRDSRHAGGVLITPRPTNELIPTQLGADETSTVTAWADRVSSPIVSDYGFVKWDLLGVKALAKQELATQFIRDHYGEEFEPNDLPVLRDPFIKDKKVADLFVKGATHLVFQFGGEGITKLLRHIKPDNAMDISVANALYRPGPMQIAYEYGDRKNGKTPVTYWHDALEPILSETLGLMCFQEQAMDLVQILAGFTPGQAENLRKIMGKLYRLPGDKAQQVMAKDHDQFIHGSMTISGLREEDAEFIWTERMLPLGDYLFNKSHSSSYGLQAWQDMHMKCYYPLALYAAGLTIEKKAKKDEQVDFFKGVMREASGLFGIEISPPDINNSGRGWTIGGRRSIRYGLVSISGVGGAAANEIIRNRPYKDFKDYLARIPSTVGTNVNLALCKAGAFDLLHKREKLLAQTRAWPETVEKIKVTMSCGCEKSRTVKLTDKMRDRILADHAIAGAPIEAVMELAIDITCGDIAAKDPSCNKHPGAPVQSWEKLPATVPVATWMKDHQDEKFAQEYEAPSQADIIKAEEEVLNIPLSLAKLIVKYTPFIDERIWTEEEVDELPRKPARKKGEHDMGCQCKDCKAAYCVVGGEIVKIKTITTKRGDQMAFASVVLGTNHYEVTFFPHYYTKYNRLFNKPTAFLIKGYKDERNGQSQIIAFEMEDVAKLIVAESKPKIKFKAAA